MYFTRSIQFYSCDNQIFFFFFLITPIYHQNICVYFLRASNKGKLKLCDLDIFVRNAMVRRETTSDSTGAALC